MANQIDEISEMFRGFGPEFTVTQLAVSHPGADDDGLWSFRREGNAMEIQLESSSGNCPFLIESSEHAVRQMADTIDDAIRILRQAFKQ